VEELTTVTYEAGFQQAVRERNEAFGELGPSTFEG
jgi:hypothetical protein